MQQADIGAVCGIFELAARGAEESREMKSFLTRQDFPLNRRPAAKDVVFMKGKIGTSCLSFSRETSM
jgi:hypothetical protein